MSRRLGFTLIEMVIVVGMSTVLAGMAVTILFALMKSHNIGREHLENSRTLNRLAIQFRRDVHATQEAGAVYKEGILELRLASQGGMTIRYQCLEERIDRLQLQGDKLISLESYMLPPDVDTSIQLLSQNGTIITRIHISPKKQTDKLSYAAPVQIEALPGLDARLSKVQMVSKKPATKEQAPE